ncbi:Ribosomal RNA small subunit methyltransferase D [Polystyrenella longa]|uniref:Ribosomal RNA small subunit methyltransferase D n=2 Tax=Polystyrenella longa TaxID=2528007 RepID=A0A518CRP6_9PLAN|nr:Ribosomal RNA small subunit methyltransferase D [Polystyrenella longa]
MKEYLFERLRNNVPDARVLDVFAGTGTIGLEALSRGAKSVIFIERDHRAFDILKQNISKIGVEEETFCWRTDVFRTSFMPRGYEELQPYDVIFFDPPYPMVPGLKPSDPLYKSIERLAKEKVSSEDALLLFRTERYTEFELPAVWTIVDKMSVSSSTMYFCRKTSSIDPADFADIETSMSEKSTSEEETDEEPTNEEET